MRGFGLKTSIIILLLAFTLLLFADDAWQGSAAVIRRGEFDSAGMYAASNSFTPNSKVRVVNHRTSQSVEVTILKRIENGGNVLLLLSEEAASVIGMNTNDIVNVDVYLISYGYDEIVGLPDDLPFNPDPDVYPLFEEEPAYTPMMTPVPTAEISAAPTIEPSPEPTPDITQEPLPIVTEEPSPEPVPEITPQATPEMTVEPTIEPSQEPTVEPTLEPTMEPTPELSPETTLEPQETPETSIEPLIGPSPEINEGATMEPTPVMSPMPSLEPVPEPTLIPFENPEVMTQRSPQKNFFLPPREDESYFLSDLFVVDNNASDDFPVNEAGLEDKDNGLSTSMDRVFPDKQDYVFNMGSPIVEKPLANSYDTPASKEKALNFANLDVPTIELRKTDKPEVLLDSIRATAAEHNFNVLEPILPGEKTSTMEATPVYVVNAENNQGFRVEEPRLLNVNDQTSELQEVAGIYMRADEAKVSILPSEPLPPQERTSSKPEVYADFPMNNPEDHSFIVSGPDIPPEKASDKPIATEEIPLKEESYIAFNTSEPSVPEKDTGGVIDITNDIPDPDYAGEIDVVLEPSEPKPPKGTEENVAVVDAEKPDDVGPDQTDSSTVVLVEDENRPPVNVVDNLEQGFYYVQLGAYTDKKRAQVLVNEFGKIYPVKIVSTNTMKLEVYKVLLGPLSRDESDTLLYRFKSLGYGDAFVKFVK
ncbi:MAG: SPOR domain-containing protein [Spirochaetales bacterium]|nr:SPOR domain-containing protein [Spirochaetales bacterium]